MSFASCAAIRKYMYCLIFQVAWHFVIVLIVLSDCLNQSYDTQLKTVLHLTLIMTFIRLLKPQSPLSTRSYSRLPPPRWSYYMITSWHDCAFQYHSKKIFQVFFCTMLSVCNKKLFDGSVHACIYLMIIKVALHPNWYRIYAEWVNDNFSFQAAAGYISFHYLSFF